MADISNVMERLKRYVLEHPEMTKNGFIQGLHPDTGKVAIVVNGQTKYITIDELESGHLNQNNSNIVSEPLAQPISNQTQTEQIEVMEEIPSQENEKIETLSNNNSVENLSNNKPINTLKDMQNSVLAKDETTVNRALESFAIDEKTGSISVNKAIQIVTNNSVNNVITCFRDNLKLHSDLSKYDITGKPIIPFEPSDKKEELTSLEENSFNNILVYAEVARLKNRGFTPEQIQNAKKKYSTNIQDKINVLGLNKQDEIKPDNIKQQPKSISLDLQPDKNIKKAGFADILILTIIVIIYAAIIINLITKLK